MGKIRRMVRGRSLVLTMALGAVAVAVFLATLPKAEAIIVSPGVCTYYKDATFKKVVGARGTGCCGEVFSWGTTSLYFKCERLYCLDVLCPN